jgi:hypothetical protein
MGDTDRSFEELLREAAAETDPWRHATPPSADPARLMARLTRERESGQETLAEPAIIRRRMLAEPAIIRRRMLAEPAIIPRRMPGRFVSRRSVTAMAGAFAGVLAASVCIVWLGRDHAPAPAAEVGAPTASARPSGAGYGVPGLLPLQFPQGTAPARPVLATLARAAAARSDPPVSAKYIAIRLQTWSAGPTQPSTPDDGLVHAIDERTWWTSDFSGEQIKTVLPPQSPGVLVASPSVGPQDFAQVVYGPGDLKVAIPDPSAQAPILAGQIDAYLHDAADRTLVTAAADLFRWHPLGAGQRAALLQVLHDADGLIDRGEATDRAGRPGQAISLDTTADGTSTRDILVFDRGTGRLLDYERVLLSRPGGSAPALVAYTLYVAAGGVDTLP